MEHCKCYFLHQTETCLLEFWLCCGSKSFSMSSELRFVKWVRCFDRNSIVKWVIFSASYCWFWDFLLENLKLKKTDDVKWNVWTNIKNLCARNNIFKKRIPNVRFWIIFILVHFYLFYSAPAPSPSPTTTMKKLPSALFISFKIIQQQPSEKSCKNAVLKSFAIFIGKHLRGRIFLTQNIAKFFRAPILKNFCECYFWKCSWNWEKLKIVDKRF